MPPRSHTLIAVAFQAAALAVAGCGDQGLFPTTIDPGSDFGVATVVFDEGYYYCRVEPVLLARRCGPGEPALGDASGGCHDSATGFRLSEYMPPVAESCGAGVVAMGAVPRAAQQNYQTAQAQMRQNPAVAPLLLRATGRAKHPRTVFEASSSEAEIIRQWATQYSTQ